jgi:hypothetical protein
MKQSLKIIGLSFVVLGLTLAMFGLIVFGNSLPQQRVYDCGMADWHPDIPNKVREECRKLRNKNYNEENKRTGTIV